MVGSWSDFRKVLSSLSKPFRLRPTCFEVMTSFVRIFRCCVHSTQTCLHTSQSPRPDYSNSSPTFTSSPLFLPQSSPTVSTPCKSRFYDDIYKSCARFSRKLTDETGNLFKCLWGPTIEVNRKYEGRGTHPAFTVFNYGLITRLFLF
jgi:hypothetical protein